MRAIKPPGPSNDVCPEVLLQGYKVLLYFVLSAMKSCDSQSIKIQLDEKQRKHISFEGKENYKISQS